MARCGCAGAACNCFVSAGANVTVTGNGSAGNPFVVSAASVGLSVLNSTTVALTLTGTVLSAAVKLDTAAGNLLFATANGLRLDCTAVASCITGLGTTHVADTATVDMSISGAGTSPSPYVISGVVVPGPGMAVTGAGVVPNVGGTVWPWACPQADAAPLYVSGTGVLHGDPPAAAGVGDEDQTGGTSPGSTAVPVGDTVIDTATITVINPSPCRVAVALLTYSFDVDFDVPAGDGVVMSGAGVDLFRYVNTGASPANGVGTACTYTTQQIVAAGATTAFSQPLSVRQLSAGGANYTATRWRGNYLLVTT